MSLFAQETYLTPEQVAAKLQLSITTVYNLIRAAELPAVRLGKSYRIAQSALENRLGHSQKTLPPVVRRFVEQLRASDLATAVTAVTLFGSHARGDVSAASDIDLLLVLTSLSEKNRAQLLKLEDAVEAEFGYVSSLEVLKFTHAQWATQQRARTGLYRNVEREGVALW